ncbi:MAG: PstS family phosphate ABC transporter substrate-binding protein [Fusobacteriaceae bacterium]|nr:PstS family phosphate ABC transporter substrate-binding protein [Fusobacteriaceae bacterium]
MNKIKIFGVALLTLSLFVACGKKDSTNKLIQVKGSDTILNLTQKVSEEYMKENPKAKISVTGGGSGTGIAALVNKTTDIAMASRNIKDSEREDAKKNGVNVKEVIVGYDAISIAINKKNTVSDLTKEQLRDIYLGKITNWKEVGGADKKIIVLSRDSSSGTHVYFKEHILRKGDSKGTEEFGTAVLFLPSNEAIKQQVQNDEGAIGYIGLGYVDDSVKISNVEGIHPSLETVKDKSYPIARAVFWYVPESENEGITNFVNYMLSDKGQKIVVDEGFVPVK